MCVFEHCDEASQHVVDTELDPAGPVNLVPDDGAAVERVRRVPVEGEGVWFLRGGAFITRRGGL